MESSVAALYQIAFHRGGVVMDQLRELFDGHQGALARPGAALIPTSRRWP
jgi:hypothetical protein